MSFQTTSGKLFYRVGDVIITTNNQNPSLWYGGIWELFASGKTIVCIDTSQDEFNTINKTGGSKYLQSHDHSANMTVEGSHTHIASEGTAGLHQHYIFRNGAPISSDADTTQSVASWATKTYSDLPYSVRANSNGAANVGLSNNAGEHSHSVSVSSSGEHSHTVIMNASGNGNAQNLQPFVVVYMWIRIA